jgi:hypothetical protein
MTISFEFSTLRHGRACPGHPRAHRILLIARHSAFFRNLLKPYEPAECRQWGIYSSSLPRLNGRSRSQRRPLPPTIGQLGFGQAQKVDAGR